MRFNQNVIVNSYKGTHGTLTFEQLLSLQRVLSPTGTNTAAFNQSSVVDKWKTTNTPMTFQQILTLLRVLHPPGSNTLSLAHLATIIQLRKALNTMTFTQNPVVVKNPFLPSSLTGYQAYFGILGRYSDAAGTIAATTSGTVKAWRDLLGSGAIAVEATNPPTLAAGGGLIFGGSTRLVLPTGMWNSARTVIVAMAPLIPSGNNFGLIGSVQFPGRIIYGSSNGNALNIYRQGTGAITGGITFGGTSHGVYAARMSATSDKLYILADEIVAYGTGPGATGAIVSSDPAAIGRTGTFNSWDSAAPIYAVYLNSTEMPTADILTTVKWMQKDVRTSSYGLGSNLLMHGNSLILGSATAVPAVDGVCPKLQALLPSTSVVNLGTGGLTTPQLTARQKTECCRNWDVRRKNVLVLLEITNDYNNAAQTVSQCLQHYQDYVTAAITSGVFDFIFVCTVPKNLGTTTGTDETNRQLINAGIIANAKSWGAENYIDLGSLPHVGTGSFITEPTYWANDLHPNGTGNTVIAQKFADDLASYIV